MAFSPINLILLTNKYLTDSCPGQCWARDYKSPQVTSINYCAWETRNRLRWNRYRGLWKIFFGNLVILLIYVRAFITLLNLEIS